MSDIKDDELFDDQDGLFDTQEPLDTQEKPSDTQDELTLDDVIGGSAGENAEFDLESLFNVEAEDEEDFNFVEDISGFAKGFPDWDLLPPAPKAKKTTKK